MTAARKGLGTIGLCLLLGFCGAMAQANLPSVVAAQSDIGFVSHQMGVPIAGSFRSFDVQMSFDPATPQKGRLAISVDVTSVELPTDDAMREVVKPAWFDAQHFPRAVFESSAIRGLDRGRYEITGSLTIKGHAREVVVPVVLEQTGELTFASGALVVHRLDFSIGEGDWTDTSVVDDDVQIKFRLALSGIGPI